jgi:hypothetical protein
MNIKKTIERRKEGIKEREGEGKGNKETLLALPTNIRLNREPL